MISQPITPTYRRHRSQGLDRAFVLLNGKRIYLGPYDTLESRRKFDRVVAEWLVGGRQLKPQADTPTIGELCDRFLQHADGYYRRPDGTPTNEPATLRMALRPLRQLYGNTPAGDFGPLALKAVRQCMIDCKWCRGTVNNMVMRVKMLFRWATENELVPAGVHTALVAVAGLKRGRCDARESEPIRPVPAAHIDAVRPHVARQVWALIELQLLTGARAGELVKLRPIDLDTTGKVWTATLDDHKMAYRGLERVIFIGPQAQAVVRQFMVDRPVDAYLFSPAEADTARRAVLSAARKIPITYGNRPGTNRRRRPAWKPGDHYTVNTYRQAIQRGCDSAGVDRWSPHRLRHNAATAVRCQFGLEAAQLLLGHARADVTEIYAETSRSKAVELAAAIG